MLLVTVTLLDVYMYFSLAVAIINELETDFVTVIRDYYELLIHLTCRTLLLLP